MKKQESRLAKLAEDTRALRYAGYQEQLKDMIKRLGGNPEVLLKEDADENIPIIMNAKTLVNEMNDLHLFTKDALGNYTVMNKISAITVMTASLVLDTDYNQDNDKARPLYSAVSQWLGIPRTTLKDWWKNSEMIFREQTALGYSAVMRSTFKMLQVVEKYTDALLTVDVNKLVTSPSGVSAATNVIKTITFIAQLLHERGGQFANLGNASGQTIEHKDSKVEFVIPEKLEGKK